jgi:hypothetical protein
VLTRLHGDLLLSWLRRAGCGHRFRSSSSGPSCPGSRLTPELAVFLAEKKRLSSKE